FQSRFTDADGVPLKVDGVVGSLTWETLFGPSSVRTVTQPGDALLARVLQIATSQIGVMEQPTGSNRGPQIDNYLRTVGLEPSQGSFAWCAAFVYWCFGQASEQLRRGNPVVKTAGVMDHWNKAGTLGTKRVTQEAAVNDPSLLRPGHIFIISTGGGS